jgi:hypothetical protein
MVGILSEISNAGRVKALQALKRNALEFLNRSA